MPVGLSEWSQTVDFIVLSDFYSFSYKQKEIEGIIERETLIHP